MDISNYSSIPSNMILLKLFISGSSSTISVYSSLSILPICQTIRYLSIIVEQKDQIENANINLSFATPSINENDLSISPYVTSFDLEILARCDRRSTGYILRCMSNLMCFYFNLATQKATWPFPGELLDDHVWQDMLECYVPHLSKFEFQISIFKKHPKLNLLNFVNSFEYFVKKYPNWNIITDRWKFYCLPRREFIMLRTFYYRNHKANLRLSIPVICSERFTTQSIASNNNPLFCVLKK
ncbi:unnamed protein product [Rotaria magnacalcarata]|uniref:Uncharacterized protein n=2 Tax=Rotaria magnacalcarata TaxID=392030 RepID=A0A8S2Z3L1_9BILA|nr:unnamed protein product [Rotaria magnacalcarata]